MGNSSKEEVTDDGSRTASVDAVATTTAIDHFAGVSSEGEEKPITDLATFEEGETVMVYFKECLYLGKIKKVDHDENGWRYFVHYAGWKDNWDEWVRINRLMKATEENKKKLATRKKTDEMENNAKTGSKSKVSNGPKGKKRKTVSAQKEKAAPSSEKHINIPIPPALRKQLLDDWESVKKSNKLVKLPRSPNVDEIMSKYQDYRQKKETRLAGCVGELVNGLRRYFDKALPAMLLYPNERQQYEEAVINEVAPSAVYGAEHLLRLFVKLPEMLQNTDIEEKVLIQFQQNAVDFVKEVYFGASYGKPAPPLLVFIPFCL
ncbi:OLC1v1016899C1 [Oldenlandia corymbosa var. corymbosa]|uniref:OLC1v1016899C1 n=1 Tax=Oldenlandia corymbosa var. corymbosa TaxID=529605 RepID=A0AAV1E8B3_OLDCO|nr:OLC1v1016899C1 [Oldenlandia corymbosa var. corymbosa]